VSESGISVFGRQDIAALAHQLWQARGCPPMGWPGEDWRRAERDLQSRASGTRE
jgi:uncharacterized protein with PIN domain